jgi:uncharacterized protein with von Willebrand factor type A (vWA) domain
MDPAGPARLVENLLIFGRLLRRAGIGVHPGRMLDVIAALQHVDLGTRDEVYHTCRALLVFSHEHLALFDRAFDAFWREHGGGAPGEPAPDPRETAIERVLVSRAALVSSTTGDDRIGTRSADGVLKTWSDLGALARKDLASLTSDETVQAAAALARLVWAPGERRTRRWIRGRGPRIDMRRSIAESLRTGGDVVTLEQRRRHALPRPLVLLCDISGSMERYSRMLLHFAHAVTKRHVRVEVFLFSTGLTRITRQMRLPRTDQALAAISRSVSGWSGGTRIGAAVKDFNRRWSRQALAGGGVVLLISDGWDRGDPVELAAQIARLHRRCHRLVWLNPLIGSPDYAPLTRGLQAALPFVDDFLPARNLVNLADLARHLNTLA